MEVRAMSVTLYGIPNCSTVKKARAWLEENGVAYHFHDYKKHGVDTARLARWCEQASWEKLVNRSGMTWRKLPESDRAIADSDAAIALMAAHPSVIRRPVVEYPGGLLIGFSIDDFGRAFR
jgi:arsenate reductase